MTRRWWLVPVIAAALVAILCLLVAHQGGYPLDDAWIHQDFARTLATTGQFAYLPGRSGAGSTSPLWVVLLLPPQMLFHGQPPIWLLVGWTTLLGTAALASLGVVAGLVARTLAGQRGASARAVGLAGVLASLAVVAEWHLVWAAMSGMETDLFALLVLWLFYSAARGAPPLALGLLTAFSIAVRPEAALAGLVVAAAVLWAAVGGLPMRWRWETLARWARVWLVPFAVSAAVGCIPYLAVNLAASGHLLPSTISAKASYYAPGSYAQAALSDVIALAETLIGASPAVLLALALSYSHWLFAWTSSRQRGRDSRKSTPQSAPQAPHMDATVTARTQGGSITGAGDRPALSARVGVPSTVSLEVRAKRPEAATALSGAASGFALRLALWLWVLGLVAAYAGRGVATIVHDRYLMPILPALLALAATDAALFLLERRRLLVVVAGALLVGAGLFSAGRGAQIYGDNVRFIDGTQVATALWLRAHATPGSLVATHDIGAIGYVAGHPVIDLAGLVDPQIVPLLTDQPKLEAYLRRRHVAYVAMYTTWFPPPNSLVRDLAPRQVYHAPAAPTFVVYRTGW